MVLCPSFQGPGVLSVVRNRGLDTEGTEPTRGPRCPDPRVGLLTKVPKSTTQSHPKSTALTHKAAAYCLQGIWTVVQMCWKCLWSQLRLWPPSEGWVPRLSGLTCPHPRRDGSPRPGDPSPLTPLLLPLLLLLEWFVLARALFGMGSSEKSLCPSPHWGQSQFTNKAEEGPGMSEDLWGEQILGHFLSLVPYVGLVPDATQHISVRDGKQIFFFFLP